MLARKLAASFLVIVFVLLALPNFLIYALSKTYLNTDFYRKEEVIAGTYDFAVDKVIEALREDSDQLKGYFKVDELKDQVEKVFTKNIFAAILADFADQIDNYKKDTTKPLVISLRGLRENLLTVGNNLAYIIYQNLPTCSDDQLAEAAKNRQAPECAPKSVPYDQVVRPLTDNFEATIYNQIPEELSNLDRAVPLRVLVNIESYRNISFIVLIAILAMIVLIIYGKTSTIVGYIATAFLLGGTNGYGFSYLLDMAVKQSNTQFSDPKSQEFMSFMLGFMISEIQRLSILFIGAGVVLFLIRFVLQRTVEDRQNTI